MQHRNVQHTTCLPSAHAKVAGRDVHDGHLADAVNLQPLCALVVPVDDGDEAVLRLRQVVRPAAQQRRQELE